MVGAKFFHLLGAKFFHILKPKSWCFNEQNVYGLEAWEMLKTGKYSHF